MKTRSGHTWLAIAQFTISVIAIIFCWVYAAVSLLSLVINLSDSSTSVSLDLNPFGQAINAFLISLLFFPSAFLSLSDLLNKTIPVIPDRIKSSGKYILLGLIIIWPLLVWSGEKFSSQAQFGALYTSLISIPSVGIPILVWVQIGRWRLPKQSSQRNWGLFNTGQLSGPLLAVPIEILFLLLVLAVVVILYWVDPGTASMLRDLYRRLIFAQGEADIFRIVKPFLLQPTTMIGVLAVFSIFIPLIEELIKPIGMWIMPGHTFTPDEGFVSGLLCGAGFAFFESLNVIANYANMDWTFLVVARAGTSLLHITTTALVGYGLASAWQERKYFRLGGVFLLGISLHGLWNTVSLGLSLMTILESASFTGSALDQVYINAPWALGILAAIMVFILIVMNTMIRKRMQQEYKPSHDLAAFNLPPSIN